MGSDATGTFPRVSVLILECAVRSDVGPVRTQNEDAVFATSRLVAVADGVGGHAAGEVASQTVIDVLAHLEKCWLSEPLPDALSRAVQFGNERIGFIAECRPEMAGMGTTLTAVALHEGYVIANIGDSRTYLYRDGVLTQLTRDDSYLQMLIDRGIVDADSARTHPHRNLVLEALDGRTDCSPALMTHPARAGDRLLLCSDGLSDMLDAETIRETLNTPLRDRCAELLLELALDAGARDNVSVIVADVGATERPPSTWVPATRPS
jgi:serine/threonine protein phosphatase PrpC